MRRVAVDTNVFLYALGKAHSLRDPCRAILAAAGEGRLHLTISVEVIQEYAHVRLRRGVPAAQVLDEATGISELCEVVALDTELMLEALSHVAANDCLHVRDGIIAAAVARADLDELVTADRAFDEATGITRLDPAQLTAQLAGGA